MNINNTASVSYIQRVYSTKSDDLPSTIVKAMKEISVVIAINLYAKHVPRVSNEGVFTADLLKGFLAGATIAWVGVNKILK